MTIRILIAALAVAAIAPSQPQEKKTTQADDPVLLESRMWEYQERRAVAAEENDRFWSSNSATLSIAVTLPKDRTEPSSWGALEIASATDDTGANIKPDKPSPYQGFFNAFDHHGATLEKGTLVVPIELALPARKAKSISVKGRFVCVYGGEKKNRKIDRVKKAVGKTVLEGDTVNVSVTVEKVEGNELTLKIKGNSGLIVDATVRTSDGTALFENSISYGDDELTYGFEKEIPDDASLTIRYIHFSKGIKKTAFAFELKDMPLP